MLYFIVSEPKRFLGNLSKHCSDILWNGDYSLHLVNDANRKLHDLEVKNCMEQVDARSNDAAGSQQAIQLPIFRIGTWLQPHGAFHFCCKEL